MNGIFNIYKPSDMTSHDVVRIIRRMMPRGTKVGHAGTLDPDAMGVLLVCVGKATRLVEFFMDYDKGYKGEMVLGISTDTQDASGNIIEENDNFQFQLDDIEEIFKEFTGEMAQIPPMYSALKYRGKKLYELAREGRIVEREPRKVIIYSLQVLGVKCKSPEDLLRKEDRILFETVTSKGTYVRTLCHDIGQRLGCGAHLDNLERISCGPFSSEGSHSLKEVEEAFHRTSLHELLEPMDKGLSHFPAVYAKESSVTPLLNGVFLDANGVLSLPAGLYAGSKVRIYSPDGDFLAIGQTSMRGDNLSFRPLKVLKTGN
jgi:tRNA pseudouridine55 synthase